MKITTEICDTCEEEIVIKCRAKTEVIHRIENMLQTLIKNEREMVLYSSGTEHYVPVSRILFFETDNGKVYAHTASHLYTTEYKLFELEDILPISFVRISKSSIANIMLVSSLRRELVGNGELTFKNSNKTIYFSRYYYKTLRIKMDEMRLKK